MALSSSGRKIDFHSMNRSSILRSATKGVYIFMLRVFGQSVDVTEEMECLRGGDHRKLVMDARLDCFEHCMDPDVRYALCGRCVKAVSLKV